jgi:putative oxidoreductase
MPFLSTRFSPYAYALMRIVIGLLFAIHGSQKLLNYPPGKMPGRPPLASLIGVAGIIELVGGLLVAVGLLAPIAAFVCSGEMAVAYFKAHAPQGLFPIQNQGELAVVYCFIFLFIAAYGSGIWSLDSAFSRGSRSGRR